MANRIEDKLNFTKKIILAAAGMAALAGPIGVGMMNAPPIRAQSAPSPGLTFEEASVKPSAPVPKQGGVYFGPSIGGPGTPDPGQITWSYATLRNLLMTAYDVDAYQVSGPSWLGSERYDIVAKVPSGATKEQVNVMWRNLLAERFGVTLHHESKEFDVEELVVAKGGSKLKETAEDPNAPWPPGPPKEVNGELIGPGMIHHIYPFGPNGPRTHTVAKAQPLSKLTTMMTNQFHHPVLDKTGLTGKYDFTFDFTPDLRGMLLPPPPPPRSQVGRAYVGGQLAPVVAAPPNLAAVVLQQLGLDLVANKVTLGVVVVDKAERVPTGN